MKFTVLNNDDIWRLSGVMVDDLERIKREIAKNRKKVGKKEVNNYLVINLDEPYAEEVVEIMKRHGHWG